MRQNCDEKLCDDSKVMRKKESLNLWSLISDELLKVKSLRSHNEIIHIWRKWSEVKWVCVGWLTQHHLSCPPVHPDLLTRLLIKAPQNFGFCRSKISPTPCCWQLTRFAEAFLLKYSKQNKNSKVSSNKLQNFFILFCNFPMLGVFLSLDQK